LVFCIVSNNYSKKIKNGSTIDFELNILITCYYLKATLVGYRTKKVLFMGVKNKFCATCVRTKNGDKPKDHNCFKN